MGTEILLTHLWLIALGVENDPWWVSSITWFICFYWCVCVWNTWLFRLAVIFGTVMHSHPLKSLFNIFYKFLAFSSKNFKQLSGYTFLFLENNALDYNGLLTSLMHLYPIFLLINKLDLRLMFHQMFKQAVLFQS